MCVFARDGLDDSVMSFPLNRRYAAAQDGAILLEALIAIVIFAFGLIGLLGIQASAVGLSIDAKYRADAAYLANQAVSMIWLDRTNILNYEHRSNGAVCNPVGATAVSPNIHNAGASGAWTYQVEKSLPGATENKQQIKITPVVTATGTTYQVEVGVCWKRPQETTWHNHVTATQIPI